MSSIFVILKHAYLKFSVSKWLVKASKQASKQANIHTHARNEVTLVWGSLRLCPINLTNWACTSKLWVIGDHTHPPPPPWLHPQGEGSWGWGYQPYYHSQGKTLLLQNSQTCSVPQFWHQKSVKERKTRNTCNIKQKGNVVLKMYVHNSKTAA